MAVKLLIRVSLMLSLKRVARFKSLSCINSRREITAKPRCTTSVLLVETNNALTG